MQRFLFIPSLLWLAACADRPLQWSAEFESPALEARAVRAEARILAGGCDSTDVRWSEEYVVGSAEPTSEPPLLGEGTYGFSVRVIDVECEIYAEGCTEVALPREQDSLVVSLAARAPLAACSESCLEGRCVSAGAMSCAPGTLDCNGLGADGCESRLDDLGTCGGCGGACGVADSFCERLPSGVHECAVICGPEAGLRECGEVCTDVASDPLHCGDCARACDAPAGTRAICVSGECRSECRAGRADCNRDPADGCEMEGACP